MAERRYSDEEVAAIFERAAKSEAGLQRQQPHVAQQGMTLGDLLQIGRDAGIPADLVASAARQIDLAGHPTERKYLGLTIGVGRTVELPRRLTDDEWERLVADVRETFDARGTLRKEGSTRIWSNGNLQIMLEPTAAGHRLRMRTVKGEARGYVTGGIALVTVGVSATIFRSLVPGVDPGMVATMWGFIAAAGIMLATKTVRLPSWAKTRQRQMEDIAARAVAIGEDEGRGLLRGDTHDLPDEQDRP